jgi:hypothetical protein
MDRTHAPLPPSPLPFPAFTPHLPPLPFLPPSSFLLPPPFPLALGGEAKAHPPPAMAAGRAQWIDRPPRLPRPVGRKGRGDKWGEGGPGIPPCPSLSKASPAPFLGRAAKFWD